MEKKRGFYSFLAVLVLTGFAWTSGCSEPSGIANTPPPSNTIPSWDSDPTVATAAGGFTLNEGTVSGNPAPTVLYYYAKDPAKVPGEYNFEDDAHWNEATVGLPTIAAIDDYNCYGVAVNSEGTSLSSRVDFTIPAPVAGDTQTIAAGDLVFDLQYCPGASADSMPIGTDDAVLYGSIISAFWLSETEVTYELWKDVITWAAGNGYSFANTGTRGDGSGDTDQHPVSMLNWRDAMLFGNALTEWYNANNGNRSDLSCVYHTNSAYTDPIRQVDDSEIPDVTAGAQDNPYIDTGADGFRLPKMYEWECAARYIDGSSWTPGNYASGATEAYTSAAECSRVAVYGTSSAAAVKSKDPNTLSCYDMSGNMWEFCFDEWYPWDGSHRVVQSGGWNNAASTLQVGQTQNLYAYTEMQWVGFRLCRNP